MRSPCCDEEMSETHERVPITHAFGRAKNTLKNKTQYSRVFNCPKCSKKFVLAKMLKEVKN